MSWQLWFNLLPPCPALLCMSHTLNSTQVSSNVVKSSTKKRQRVLVRLSIHILFISLTLWMPTCPSFVGIIFQKHSGRMKQQNVVHENPAGVSKCVNSQRNLSQMSHRVKNLSENVTQGKSMSGLLWRSRSAMSTNICKHLSDRILGESETTSKTHKKQTRPSCIILDSIKNWIDQFRTLNCFWPQVRPSHQDVLCICCPPTDCSAIYLCSTLWLISLLLLLVISHLSLLGLSSDCSVFPLLWLLRISPL